MSGGTRYSGRRDRGWEIDDSDEDVVADEGNSEQNALKFAAEIHPNSDRCRFPPNLTKLSSQSRVLDRNHSIRTDLSLLSIRAIFTHNSGQGMDVDINEDIGAPTERPVAGPSTLNSSISGSVASANVSEKLLSLKDAHEMRITRGGQIKHFVQFALKFLEVCRCVGFHIFVCIVVALPGDDVWGISCTFNNANAFYFV